MPKKTSQVRPKNTPKKTQTKKKKCASTPLSEPVLANEDGTLTEEGRQSFVSGTGVPYAIPGQRAVSPCKVDIPHHLDQISDLLYELVDTLPSAKHYQHFKRLPGTARQTMRMVAGAMERVYEAHENSMKEGDE